MEIKQINDLHDNALSKFKLNLKFLIDVSNCNQKEISEKLNISPAAISGYLSGKTKPSLFLLIAVKEFAMTLNGFDKVTIDQLLFSDLKDIYNPKNENAYLTNNAKYMGIYYAYYFDSNYGLKDNANQIKYGLVQIGNQIENDILECQATFSIENFQIVKNLKKQLENSKNKKLNEIIPPQKIYTGKLVLSQNDIFITLKKIYDKKENVLIILYRPDSNKSYIGGLGTLSSIANGNDISEPVIQLVGISKYMLNLRDEQLSEYLIFSNPKSYDINNDVATKKICELAESMYSNQTKNENPFRNLDLDEKKILLNSNIRRLVNNSVKNNILSYAKISRDKEKEFYKELKASQLINK